MALDKKKRLDLYLSQAGFGLSRNRAAFLIAQGAVRLQGKVILKPSYPVEEGQEITIDKDKQPYVARSALKLRAALDHFAISVKGRRALDIGAAQGGFTQLLLERGAAEVIAVDVGHDQLAPLLRADPRVKLYEGVNARYLQPQNIDNASVDLLVCDVSFISLRLILPNILALMEPKSIAILLIKPQFELDFAPPLVDNSGVKASKPPKKQAKLNKQGVLRDEQQAQRIAQEVAAWLSRFADWQCHGLIASPLKGSKGNQEYLLYASKS